MTPEELDPAAIARDAALVQALSTRTAPPNDVDDPIVGHLVAWVDWLDTDVDDSPFELSQYALGRDRTTGRHRAGGKDRALGKDRVVALDGQRRRRGAMVAGATIAALVVSSGAAAAVTGDPFIVARAPLSVIEKINPFTGEDSNARETLPDPASPQAEGNKLLADAQRALANGHPQKAQGLLDQALTLLGTSLNPGQQTRVDRLADDLVAADGKSDKTNQGEDNSAQGSGNKDTNPGSDTSGQGAGNKDTNPGSDTSGQGAGNKDTNPGSDKQSGPSTDPPSGGGADQGTGKPSDPKGQGSGKGQSSSDSAGSATEGAAGGGGQSKGHTSTNAGGNPQD